MKKEPFSLKLPPDLMEKVREQAKNEHRPVNNLIELALIKYLEEIEKQKTPAD